MKIFIICPVRDLSKKESNKLEKYINMMEIKGVEVYYPPRDTNQNDSIGYNICLENMNAIKSSDEIHIFWNSNSMGSLFDFGMAFALGKKIKLINDIIPTETKSFNNVLRILNESYSYTSRW